MLLEPSHTTPARRVDALEGSKIPGSESNPSVGHPVGGTGPSRRLHCQTPCRHRGRGPAAAGAAANRPALRSSAPPLELFSRVATKSDQSAALIVQYLRGRRSNRMGLQWKGPEACESLSCLAHPHLRHQTGADQQRETCGHGGPTPHYDWITADFAQRVP